jgi:hypothetical protein
MARKNFLLKLVSLFLFWEMKAIPCERWPRNWRSRTTLCTSPFTEQCKLVLTIIEWSGRPWCTTEQEDKHISVSSLRNSLQLAASLSGIHKTPVSMSTLKRQLRDAGLLVFCGYYLCVDLGLPSGLRHCISVLDITTDPDLIPGCITTGYNWESHRAAHNRSTVVRVWPG